MTDIERMAEAIARANFNGGKSMTFDMLSKEDQDNLISLFTPEAQAAYDALVGDGVVLSRDLINDLRTQLSAGHHVTAETSYAFFSEIGIYDEDTALIEARQE